MNEVFNGWTDFEPASGRKSFVTEISSLRGSDNPSDPWGNPLRMSSFTRRWEDGELISYEGTVTHNGVEYDLVIFND